MKAFAFTRAVGVLAAMLTFGCLKPDSTGPGTDGSQTTIGDDSRVAGATSSTNWPSEDGGTQPIQVIVYADSAISFSFLQAPIPGSLPVPTRRAATVFLYRAGYNPVFDSVPTLSVDFPVSDTCRIKTESLNSLIPRDMDTLHLTMEIRSDTVRALFLGLTYSKKEMRFLEWPFPVNTSGSRGLSDPDRKFAAKPDSAFRLFQSDTSENTKFYYYIPGTPYFWPQTLEHDSLFIGPTVRGDLPLRCVKVASRSGPKAVFTIEVYALSLVKESVNDSLHHSLSSYVFKLGEPVFHAQSQGEPQLRASE